MDHSPDQLEGVGEWLGIVTYKDTFDRAKMALIPNGDVSYGYKECEQMRALIGNGGSINRLQV